MKKDSFEEKINRLEEIASELEKGLPLEESMKLFEEGMKNSAECTKILDEAEKKISILVNNNGKLEEENFES